VCLCVCVCVCVCIHVHMRLLHNIKHRGSDTWHDQKLLQQNL
jgi:hypothetical protein